MMGCGARSELQANDLATLGLDGTAVDAGSVPADSSVDEGATVDATSVDAMAADVTTGIAESGADADGGLADATEIVDAAPEADANDADHVCLDASFVVEQLPEPPAVFPWSNRGMTVQPDGKILVFGFPVGTAGYGSPGNTLAVVRYDVHGALDPAFGNAGVATLTPPVGKNWPAAIALQSDGQILVAGFTGSDAIMTVSYVARLSAAGALDTSFGTNGFAMAPVPATRFWTLAVRPDGSILAVGDHDPGSLGVFLTQFTSAGAVDTSFGTNGYTTTALAGRYALAQYAVIQEDGKVVVGGEEQPSPNPSIIGEPLLARYTATGTLDTTFGDGGLLLPTDTPSYRLVTGLVLQSTGAIVAAVDDVMGGPLEFILTRYTSAGAVDTTFGTGGSTPLPFNPQAGFGLVLLPGDALAVGGSKGNDDLEIGRYTSNGALDTTFATGGMALTSFPGDPQNIGIAIALGPQGLVIEGHRTKPGTDGGTESVLDLGWFGCP
jgi:uncharacterized delta-60 repeat protein